MVARIIFLVSSFFIGCASAPLKPVPKQCSTQCNVALDLRDKTMKKFERLCIALSYVAARHFDDQNVQREVREGVMVCDYIYGIRKHG